MRASNSGSGVSAEMLLLAAGGCAEHEWGIAELKSRLGVNYESASISDVLTGRGSEKDWPVSVEDYRVTTGAEVTYVEVQLSIPAAVARKVAAEKERTYDKGLPQKVCRAYLDAMTADGGKRVPSVTIDVGVLCLVGDYRQESLDEAIQALPAAKPGKRPVVSIQALKTLVDAASGRNIWVPEVKELLCKELARRGHGPQMTDEKRADATPQLEPRAAWSSSEFCVVVFGDDVQHLSKFAQGFREGQVYCGLKAENNPFARSGLAFIHEDANTPELQEKTRTEWAAHRKLLEAVRETGIVPKLQASGRRYYALSPRFEKNGDLVFWLNPQEHSRYNHGWMTVRDLEDWIAGKGKIIKAAA
jgi:hypothetical protein